MLDFQSVLELGFVVLVAVVGAAFVLATIGLPPIAPRISVPVVSIFVFESIDVELP